MKRNVAPYDLVDLIQGTPEWIDFRFNHLTASQFAAAVGLCPYQKRDALLQEKLTRTERDVSDFQAVLYERGHRAEAALREWSKENLGIDFAPAVIQSRKAPDLIASLDGFASEHKIIFEAKYMGEKSINALKEGVIKPNHMCQVQAQLYVSGASKCVYFAVDDKGNAAKMDIYPDAFYQLCIPKIVAKFMSDLNALKTQGEVQ
jgi:putative phage-type endonuclease